MPNWGSAGSGALSGAGAGAAFGPWGALIGGAAGGLMGMLSPEEANLAEIYGNLDPATVEQLIAAGEISPTELAKITEDPALRSVQMRALANMANLGESGGMDIQAQTAHEQAIQRSAQQERSQREAVLENMAQRGMRGSGAELMAQLQGGQTAATANSMAGAQAASDARTRALQAMAMGGQMAGNVRGQDYSVAANKAQAQDAINRFNAQNRVNAYQTSFDQRLAKAGGQVGTEGESYRRGNERAAAGGALLGQGMDWYANRDKKRKEAAAGGGFQLPREL
jgi:hypothetical protein